MTELPPPASWRLDQVRLPKILENEVQGPVLHAALRRHASKLWSGGTILVPCAAWSPALAAALAQAQAEHRVERGLEGIERTLEREARGLSMADARNATERGSRVSRLLLLSADGTERFYRQAERLLCKQGLRLLALRLDVDSSQLASVMPEASGVIRALLIEHKDSVTRVLLASYASDRSE